MGWGEFKSCNLLLQRLENNDETLKEMVILPAKIFSDKDVERIAEALRTGRNTKLRSISASGFALNPSTYSLLASAIASQVDVGITHISIGDTAMGDQGIISFCSALEQSRGGLIEHLDLSLKDMSEQGASTLGAAFGSSKNLRVLDISRNKGIGDAGMKALCLAVHTSAGDSGSHPHFPALIHLNISECNVNDEGVVALSHCLLGKKIGEMIESKSESISYRAEGIHLNASSNALGPIGCTALASIFSVSIKGNSLLNTLNLNNCSIGDDGLKALVDSLKSVECGGGLKILHLSNNKIGEAGAKVLGAALNGNLMNLTELCLSNNAIGQEGVLGLGLDSEGCKKLSTLDLSKTNCGSEGACSAINCHSLSSLRLFDNDLRCNGFESLMPQLHSGSSSVNSLDLGGNRALDSAVAGILNSVLTCSNSSLRTLEIGGNEIGEKSENILKEIRSVCPELDIAHDRPNAKILK